MKVIGILPAVADLLLRQHFPEEWEFVVLSTEDELTDDHLEGADVLVTTAYNIVTRKTVERLAGIKLIQQVSVGTDSIDTQAAREVGVPVANVPTGNIISVAEYVIGTAISLVRKFDQLEQLGRDGQRPDRGVLQLGSFEIYGKTLGIVGLGNIGREVAVRARAFGMNLIYYGRHPVDAETEDRLNIRRVSFDEVLAQSDVLTLHVPFTDETKDLIGKDELAKMKSTAVLINTARGGVVNEAALADALNNSVIAAAAVDVFETEPIDPDNPLLTAENAFLTPHVAGVTNDCIQRMFHLAYENILRVAKGEEPIDRVC